MLALEWELAAPAAGLRLDEIAADQERGARSEVETFRAALEDARARGQPDGDTDVAYDSRDPRQDAWAEVLIQYLVRLNYAEVRTEELEPWHYRYHIRIDWQRLRRMAADEGYPLSL